MHISAAQAGGLATFFSGLAHPTRVQLMGLLLDGERSVSDLMRALNLPQARVSRHLQTLRRCGCCTARRDGSWVYYRARHPRASINLLALATTSLQGTPGTEPIDQHS